MFHSAGLTSYGNFSVFEERVYTTRRVFTPSLSNTDEVTPVNSTLGPVRVPILMIEKFHWLEDYTKSLPTDLYEAITNRSKEYLTISGGSSPLARVIWGNAAMLKNEVWEPAKVASDENSNPAHYRFPEKYPVEYEKFVVILVEKLVKKDGWMKECDSQSTRFGQMPKIKYLSISDDLVTTTNCFAIAKVSLKAGSFRSPELEWSLAV